MNDPNAEELDLLRSELRRMGVPGASAPEDFGLAFRSADSFFETGTTGRATRFRGRRWIAPMTVAAAAAVIGIALLAPGSQGPGPSSPPDATVTPGILTVANVLRQAANSSADLPDRSDSRFWRVDSVQQQGTEPPEKRTVWLGHQEPGLVIDDFGRADLPPAVFGLQQTQLTWDELLSLPSDPAILRARFDREVQGLANPDLAVAKMAAHLLAESPAPPEVRKALWQVIAGIRGVVAQVSVTDALGREGIGLALGTSQTGFAKYVIDPQAGRILQATTQSGKAGADVFRVTYLDQGPADQLPAG